MSIDEGMMELKNTLENGKTKSRRNRIKTGTTDYEVVVNKYIKLEKGWETLCATALSTKNLKKISGVINTPIDKIEKMWKEHEERKRERRNKKQ